MKTIVVVLFLAGTVLSPASNAATYELTFTGFWNESHVQADTYPSAAHFTTLVGSTHSAGNALWKPGEVASKGIEDVAELGVYDILQNEVNDLIDEGIAGEFISSDGFFFSSSTTTSTTTFNITADKPELTLISMIAPSPDWFVGVSGLSLLDENGWIPNLLVDLTPWDAGTENGFSFDLFNLATNPQGVIGAPSQFSDWVGNPVIGQLSLELLTVPVPAAFWLFLSSLGVLGLKSKRFKNYQSQAFAD